MLWFRGLIDGKQSNINYYIFYTLEFRFEYFIIIKHMYPYQTKLDKEYIIMNLFDMNMSIDTNQ